MIGRLTLVLLCGSVLAANATTRPDGMTIVNSGSTNTIGWSIALRSDGTATIDARAFMVPQALAVKLFADAAAARNAHVLGRACMKSASFGTHLNVIWHGWTSPDLTCRPMSLLASTLAVDVGRITEIAQPPSGLRRIGLPIEPRRTPPAH
jgi:hypothetical protein